MSRMSVEEFKLKYPGVGLVELVDASIQLEEGEIEKWIEGYEGLYTVTNFGKVFSYNYRRSGYKKELKFSIINTGIERPYYRILISLKNSGVGKTYVVSQLVATAFLGPNPDPDQYFVLHKDGDSTNNHVDNLYHGTHKQNTQDSLRHGTFHKLHNMGVANSSAKLNDYKVHYIRALYYGSYSLRQLGSMFQVSYQRIQKIGSRQAWRHVPELTPEEYKQLAEDFIKAYEEKCNGCSNPTR